MSRKSKQLVLTEGPILGTLTKLSAPIVASSFLGTAYNITDMAWIGLLGPTAVAGVGIGGMFTWLSCGVSNLARMGGQVHVGQLCGQGNKKEAGRYAGAAVQMSVLLGLLYSAVILLTLKQFIGFYRLDDPETVKAAMDYSRIVCGLIVFTFVNATITGLFNAQGDSKTPFLGNLFGLVINMILDPVLILGIGPVPRLGVVGGAISTVFAQVLVFAILLIAVLRRNREENVIREGYVFRLLPGYIYGRILKMGFPSGLQSFVYCSISIVMTRLIASFGTVAVAAFRTVGQIESLGWNTSDGFGSALNAFCAQNYGASKLDRVKKGYMSGTVICVLWGLFILLLFVLIPRPICSIFFHDQESLAAGIGYMMIVGVSEPFLCVELATVGALCGLGRTKLCSVTSISLTAIRIPLGYFLGGLFGITGVWWAFTIASVIKGIVYYNLFNIVIKKEMGGKYDEAAESGNLA